MTRSKKAGDDVQSVRSKARQAVSQWKKGQFGTQAEIPQESIRRVLGQHLGEVVKRYPMAIRREGQKNLWNLGVLEKSLEFDDPVTMLGHLASADASAWIDLLEGVKEKGCTTAQEMHIRANLVRMMVPVTCIPGLPNDPWAASWALYRENLLRRKG